MWINGCKIQISKKPSSWQNECRVNKNFTKESKIPCKPNYVKTVKDIREVLVVKEKKQNIPIILNPKTLDLGKTKEFQKYWKSLKMQFMNKIWDTSIKWCKIKISKNPVLG